MIEVETIPTTTLPDILSLPVRAMLEFDKQFPQKPKDWSKFTLIEHWKEYLEVKGWEGISTHQITNKTAGGNAFYIAFQKWVKRQIPGDDELSQKMRRELIEVLFPAKQKDWSQLTTIAQWKEELQKNGWEGLSTSQIENETDGGVAFYKAFKKWVKQQFPLSQSKQRDLVKVLFPAKYKDWSQLTSIAQWKEELQKNGWEGLASSEIELKRVGGAAFCSAFRKWVKREFPLSQAKRSELTQELFPAKYKDWSHLTTIDHWKEELRKNGWEGLSTSQISNDNAEGNAFYQAFNKWVNRQHTSNDAASQKKRRELVKALFPAKQKDWSHLTTINHWKKELQKNLWEGLSTEEMIKSRTGGSAFYISFRNWVKRQHPGNDEASQKKRRELVEVLFPGKHKDWSRFTTLEDWKDELQKNGWEGFSASQLQNESAMGINFYNAFKRWVKVQFPGKSEDAIFQRQYIAQQVLSLHSNYPHEIDVDSLRIPDIKPIILSLPTPSTYNEFRFITRIEEQAIPFYLRITKRKGAHWVIKKSDLPKLYEALGMNQNNQEPFDTAAVSLLELL